VAEFSIPRVRFSVPATTNFVCRERLFANVHTRRFAQRIMLFSALCARQRPRAAAP